MSLQKKGTQSGKQNKLRHAKRQILRFGYLFFVFFFPFLLSFLKPKLPTSFEEEELPVRKRKHSLVIITFLEQRCSCQNKRNSNPLEYHWKRARLEASEGPIIYMSGKRRQPYDIYIHVHAEIEQQCSRKEKKRFEKKKMKKTLDPEQK